MIMRPGQRHEERDTTSRLLVSVTIAPCVRICFFHTGFWLGGVQLSILLLWGGPDDDGAIISSAVQLLSHHQPGQCSAGPICTAGQRQQGNPRTWSSGFQAQLLIVSMWPLSTLNGLPSSVRNICSTLPDGWNSMWLSSVMASCRACTSSPAISKALKVVQQLTSTGRDPSLPSQTGCTSLES